jgi:uncharacterized protein involved in exopolysaccharide biosynthesis
MTDDLYIEPRDPDTFDVKGSLGAISRSARNHKLLVLLTCLFTLSIVTAYVYLWPPVFTATAVIMVERDTDPVRDAFYIGWNNFRKDDSRTEIELLTSTPVLTEVARDENLTYNDVYHSFLSHLSYLWRESWVGHNYQALKAKLISQPKTRLSAKEKDFILTVVSMKSGINIEVIPETNAGHINVKGPNERVAAIANRLIDVYLAQRSLRYQSEASKSVDILTDEVKQSQDRLNELENQRLAFINRNGISSSDFQMETLQTNKLTDLQSEISAARAKIATAEADLREVNRQLAAEPQSRTTSVSSELNNIRETLKLRRVDLESKLFALSERFRPDSPEVQDAQRELDKVRAMLASESEQVERGSTKGLNAVYQDLTSKRNALESDVVGARAGLAVLQDTAKQLEDHLKPVPELRMRLRELDRDVALAQDKFQQLIGKQAQASVSLATAKAAMPSMRVVEYAMPPTETTWPKTKILFPSALVVGLLFGVLAALLIDYASDRIRPDNIDRGRRTLDLFTTVTVAADALPFTVHRPEQAKSIAGHSPQ